MKYLSINFFSHNIFLFRKLKLIIYKSLSIKAYYNRNWLGSYGERNEPFGPRPSSVLGGNPHEIDNSGFYIRGGFAGSKIESYPARVSGRSGASSISHSSLSSGSAEKRLTRF
jgi:hypothetical protein